MHYNIIKSYKRELQINVEAIALNFMNYKIRILPVKPSGDVKQILVTHRFVMNGNIITGDQTWLRK